MSNYPFTFLFFSLFIPFFHSFNWVSFFLYTFECIELGKIPFIPFQYVFQFFPCILNYHLYIFIFFCNLNFRHSFFSIFISSHLELKTPPSHGTMNHKPYFMSICQKGRMSSSKCASSPSTSSKGDPGGYWWPPTYSTWTPPLFLSVFLIVEQFIIFGSFFGL